MQLPDIAIPLALPFEVPFMLHPSVVHFAMVLPVIVLLLELANLLFKRRSVSVISLLLLLLTIVLYLAAYYTGKSDGSEAFALLGADAQAELKAHRLLGTYLTYALLIPLAFKLTAMLLRQAWARGVLIVTLVMFVSFVVKQGSDGGELVYTYGVNVKAVADAGASLKAANATIDELNATVAEQNSTIEALKAELGSEAGKEQGGITKAVNEAISSVKKMFVEDNTTEKNVSKTPAAPVAKENGTADGNETNGSK